jgi:hypothetical protein
MIAGCKPLEDETVFSGLSAFPLTPLNETGIDEARFVRLIERLNAAAVESLQGEVRQRLGYRWRCVAWCAP